MTAGGAAQIHDPIRRRLMLVLVSSAAAAVCVSPAPTALAGGVVSVKRDGGAAQKHAIEEYWTARRMRAARPLEAVVSNRGEIDVRRRSMAPRNHPASFESGPVADPAVFPNTVNGRIFGRIQGIGDYSCTGPVVDAPSRSVVMTAGHCVAERGFGTAKKLVFVPAYDREARPFGTWVFDRIVAQRAWRRNSNFNFDFAAVSMSPREGVAVQDAVGAVPLAVNLPVEQTYVATGYPSNRAKGEVMWRCTGAFEGYDPRPLPNGPTPIAIGCDMAEGASGGGWQVNGALNSVSSFGYADHRKVLYGPYFGNKAFQVYSAVANG